MAAGNDVDGQCLKKEREKEREGGSFVGRLEGLSRCFALEYLHLPNPFTDL